MTTSDEKKEGTSVALGAVLDDPAPAGALSPVVEASLAERPEDPLKWKKHKKPFDEQCFVCDHEYRAEIERLYVEGRPMALLEELTNLEKITIERHMLALGLDVERLDNTPAMLRYAIGKAWERGVLDSLDADQTIKAMTELNKLNGKIKAPDNGDTGRPAQVLVIGIPMAVPTTHADQALRKAASEVIIEAKSLPLPMPKE